MFGLAPNGYGMIGTTESGVSAPAKRKKANRTSPDRRTRKRSTGKDQSGFAEDCKPEGELHSRRGWNPHFLV